MIFKLSYNSQTHLYNKTISLQSLTTYSTKIFRDLPPNFTFLYMSPKGQMTYIESDADLIGLKYCCSHSNDMIIKLHIIKNDRFEHFGIDEDIETRNVVKENLQQMAENVFARLEDQSEAEAVSEYLKETYSKVSEEITRAENQLINKEVHQYLFNLYENASRSAAQPQRSFVVQKPQRKRKAVRFSLQKPIVHKIEKQQKSVEEMVSEKVLSMIPSLVDKIYAKMEAKLNNKCKNCIKKEMDIEYAIDEEINRKLSSICIDDQNPEE